MTQILIRNENSPQMCLKTIVASLFCKRSRKYRYLCSGVDCKSKKFVRKISNQEKYRYLKKYSTFTECLRLLISPPLMRSRKILIFQE